MQFRYQALTITGRARSRTGDASGTADLTTALQLARAADELQWLGPTAAAAAEAAWLSGDTAAIVDIASGPYTELFGRDDPTRDRLAEPAFRGPWLARAGLPADGDATAVIELRETLFRLLADTPPDPSDLTTLRRHLIAAHRRARIDIDPPLRWVLDPTAPAEHAIAIAAEDLLRSPDAERVQECAGTGCGWLFIDRSRNHSRRWCSSADCGNRDRVRRHESRRRSAATTVSHP